MIEKYQVTTITRQRNNIERFIISDAIDNNAHTGTASNPNFSDTEVVLDTVTIAADNSTTINGDANADYCFKERGWLCFDIYDYEKETTIETSYVKTNLIPEHMRPWVPCKKRWKIVKEDIRESIDYLGRYYEPMQGDCVPTVVFRGTSSEWVDIGLYIEIVINGESILSKDGTITIDGIKLISNQKDSAEFYSDIIKIN